MLPASALAGPGLVKRQWHPCAPGPCQQSACGAPARCTMCRLKPGLVALPLVARSAAISARTAFFSKRRGREASQVACLRGLPCRLKGRERGFRTAGQKHRHVCVPAACCLAATAPRHTLFIACLLCCPLSTWAGSQAPSLPHRLGQVCIHQLCVHQQGHPQGSDGGQRGGHLLWRHIWKVIYA